jgi:hypothetical protein
LSRQLRCERLAQLAEQLADRQFFELRVAMRGELQQVIDHGLQARESRPELAGDLQRAGVAAQAAAEQVEIQLHRYQPVADLVGHMRSHLAEVGQPMLTRQLAVFNL